MKLLKTIFISLLLAQNVNSQGYLLTHFTANYNDLQGTTSLNNGAIWDDPYYMIPLGFSFNMLNTSGSTLLIDGDWLGGTVALHDCTNGLENSYIIPDGADIIDRGYDANTSLSNISYKIIGTNGNRVVKIEWKNVGFYSGSVDASLIKNDFTNFQLWLYESDNSIEFRFGPNSISEPLIDYEGENGTYSGVLPRYDCLMDVWNSDLFFANNTPATPDLAIFDPESNLDLPLLNGVIPDGTVYRFEQSAVGIDGAQINDKKIVKVVDVLGREIIPAKNIPMIYIYDDGSAKKIIIVDK